MATTFPDRPRSLKVDFDGEPDRRDRLTAICKQTADAPVSWRELWDILRAPVLVLAALVAIGYAVSSW